MFKKILIANRGEIACRIIQTCNRLSIGTVVVYSYADRNAQATLLADQAILLEKHDNVQAYVDIKSIVTIAKDSGCDAIHPGYGFLSENQLFAKACEKAGIVFIGPSSKAMRLLGNKRSARRRAKAVGVPTPPGLTLDSYSKKQLPTLKKEMKAIGYPCLIKAEAGGGGKGMRIVHNASELDEKIKHAATEAQNLFANPSVYVEKCIVNARHIEVQFIADHNEKVFPLGTRDCSIQRHHQKLIEEAPAPTLDTESRQLVFDYTIALVKKSGYVGVGTAEFLLDENNAFFFLEVNARLQVEHPVTECIEGLDLVELQLRVAAAKSIRTIVSPTPLENGHAIELRVCAESSDGSFLPSSGMLQRFDFPSCPGVRIDSGFVGGDYFPAHFDSLLAKVITWAPSRAEAILLAIKTLEECVIVGVESNVTLLLTLLKDTFAENTQHIKVVEEVLEQSRYEETLEQTACLLALFQYAQGMVDDESAVAFCHKSSPYKAQFSFRNCTFTTCCSVTPSGAIMVSSANYSFTCSNTVYVDQWTMQAEIAGRIECLRVYALADTFWVQWRHGIFCLRRAEKIENKQRVLRQAKELRAELPGTVQSVLVQVGSTVAVGNSLATIESMKMEHQLSLPYTVKVKAIHIKPKQSVQAGDLLFEFI